MIDLEEKIIKAVEQIKDSVVAIITTETLPRVLTEPIPSVGFGSGFVIGEGTHVITNYHVVSKAERLRIITPSGKIEKAKLLGADKIRDIAVLEIEEQLKPAKLGLSSKIRVGQIAIAVGYPLGLIGEPTITIGVISALNRTIRTEDIAMEDMIQTDAAINPGNSGGPLINTSGEVIGVNTAIIPYVQGIGFAIPINKVKRIYNDIVEYGKVITPWLGVYAITVNKPLAQNYSLGIDRGALIIKVVPFSPAYQAGLREGDIMLRIDNFEIRSIDDISRYLWEKRIGEKIRVEFIRNKKLLKIDVILDAPPSLG